MEWIDKVAYMIRKLRVVSIFSLVFTMNMLYEFIHWIMTSSPTELGEAIAVSGVTASLVALVKFIFQLYVDEKKDE